MKFNHARHAITIKNMHGYLHEFIKGFASNFGFFGQHNGCHPHSRVDGHIWLEMIVNKITTQLHSVCVGEKQHTYHID